MFCPNCGTKAEPGDRFCGTCGFPLGEMEHSQTQEQQMPPEQRKDRESGNSGWYETGRMEEQPERDQEEPKKPRWWLFILLGVILVALIAVLLVLIFMRQDSGEEGSSGETVQEQQEDGAAGEEDSTVTGGDAPEDFTLEGSEDADGEAELEPTAEETPTPTPEPEPELVTDSRDIAQIRQDYWRVGEENILNYSASSTIQQDNGVINPPIYLFDNDDQTNWQEGVEDSGEGEFLTFAFDQEYQISAMTFRLGNWKSDTYYHGNNRPKTLKLELGEYSWNVTFPDEWQEFGVRFTSPVSSSDLKITLEEIYEGTDWDDTAITEVGVWYR